MKRALMFLALASCATPMPPLVPEPGDFAFLEIKLQG
jgi:hypothetical protein